MREVRREVRGVGRGGPGKPRKPESLRLIRRHQFSLTEDMWEQILYLADQEELYVADYIRMILKRHIKEVME